MSSTEEYLKDYLCNICHAAILYPKEDETHIIKCPICGNTKEITKDEHGKTTIK